MSIDVLPITKLSGHKSSIYALCSYDDNHFLSTGGDGLIVKWKIGSWEKATLLAKVPTQAFCLAYDSDSDILYVGNMNGGLHVIYLNDLSKNQNLQIHSKGVFKILVSNDLLYTIGGDGTLRTFDKTKLVPISTVPISTKPLRSIIFTNDEKQIRIGASDGNIYTVLTKTLAILYKQEAHENSVFALAQTKKHLLSGSRDAQLKVWDKSTNSLISSLPAHLFTINDIAILSKLNIFATACRDKTIRFWQADNLKLLKSIDPTKGGHVNSVNNLLWLPKHSLLASCSDDRSIAIWSIDKK